MFENNSRYHLKKFQALPFNFNVTVLPENMENLGDLIRRRMNDVGISSKSELARRLGKSAAYVGDLINNTAKTKSGTYLPSPEVVGKLSEVLDVSESEILNAVGYMSSNESAAVPKPILEALAREGTLSPNDEILIAEFIARLKQTQ